MQLVGMELVGMKKAQASQLLLDCELALALALEWELEVELVWESNLEIEKACELAPTLALESEQELE